MRACRSILGSYIWDQRAIKGIKRTALAEMIGCDRESIISLEDRGDDVEGIIPKLMDLLELDPRIIEKRKRQDKNIRRSWLEFCGGRQLPMLIPSRTNPNSTHRIPDEILKAGVFAIENYAKEFARSKKRTVELFVRSHIRFIISPTGEFEITELGFFDPWLVAEAEL